jgi:hypothetical protein
MSTSIERFGPRDASAPAPTKPLDEAEWRAWVREGEAKDRQASAARIKAFKWLSIVGLLAAAGLWSHLDPYDIVVRFVLTSGAMIVMFQAFQSRRFAIAVVFGVLALLYNPVSPAFCFSGGWQRALVVSGAVPFVASFAWVIAAWRTNEWLFNESPRLEGAGGASPGPLGTIPSSTGRCPQGTADEWAC